jgi:hypothetical protein
MFRSILRGPPYDLQVGDDDRGCTSVIVSVAHDQHGNRVVSVISELVESDAICAEVCWEFSFSIAVFAQDDSIEPFQTQDRAIAAKYLPADIRPAIMQVVCGALRALLAYAEPPLIYWVTKDRNPPEKALRKYHLLREMAESLGYSLADEGTDRFGRRFCLMRRNTG